MRLHIIYMALAAACALPCAARNCDAATLSALHAAERGRSGNPVTVIVCGDIDAITAWPGLETVAVAGDAAIVRGDAATLTALADSDIVRAMSISRRRKVTNDVSMAAIGADAVHAGTALPRSYTGKGVVCGIFDIGVDPNHINFLNADNAPRASRVFHFTADDGTMTEYAGSESIAAFTTDDGEETHGTHTLGTMAGSYAEGSGNITYSGVAPGADIAIGCGELYDANICAGVAAIMGYAGNRPCVVNLSLGEVAGPRDGTDPETVFLNNLTGAGHIVVLAAGNDGNGQRTFTRTFTEDLQDYRTFVRPWVVDERIEGVVDLWASRGADPTVEIVLANYWTGEIFSRTTFGRDEECYALASGTASEPGDRADAVFANLFTDSRISITRSDNAGSNGRPNFWVEFNLLANAANNPAMDISVAIFVHDKPGNRIDGALEASGVRLHAGWLNGQNGYETPTGRMSISTLACGPDLISVGSWTARNTLTLLDGSVYESTLGNPVGAVSSFTSYGTLVDGRSLPLVCAPGETVVSSFSRYYSDGSGRMVADTGGFPWGYDSGTSMATPAVAGGIALWLEACPDLTPADVTEIIRTTSRPFSGKADPRHGAGCFDAHAGLQEVLRRNAGVMGNVCVGDGAPVVSVRGNVLTIVTSGGAVARVEVLDISGRTVASAYSASNSAEIAIPDLRPGIYIVTCASGSLKIKI